MCSNSKTVIKSPLTNSNNITVYYDISVVEIIDIYKKHFNINLSKYFQNIINIVYTNVTIQVLNFIGLQQHLVIMSIIS